LVKDFNAIQLKKFDLEFSVDPLFKKTSADFDEGGAKGLLLNHLSLDGEGRIVFDASDTVLEEDGDEKAEISQDGDLELDLGDLQGTYSPPSY
jgi:condensin complex subunit 2